MTDTTSSTAVARPLDEFISLIGVSFQNASVDEVKAAGLLKDRLEDNAFAVYTAEVKLGLNAVCNHLGGTYDGHSFTHWEEDTHYVVAGPCVYNNGQSAVLEWGGNTSPLSGPLQGIPVKNMLRVRLDPHRFSLRLLLENTETDTERDEMHASVAECRTWEEMTPLLKKRLPVLPAKEVFAQNREVTIISTEAKLKGDRHYWLVGVKNKEMGAFLVFLPDEARPRVGERIGILAEDKAYVVDGESFYSNQYRKLGEFEVGQTLRITKVEAKTGQYKGGYTLTCKEGLVSSNKQFEEWYKINKQPEVSEAEGQAVLLKIRKKSATGTRVAVDLRIEMEGRDRKVGLMSILASKNGAKSAAHSVPAPTPEPEPAEQDIPEVELEPVAIGSLYKTAAAAPAETREEVAATSKAAAKHDMGAPPAAVLASAGVERPNPVAAAVVASDTGEDDWI